MREYILKLVNETRKIEDKFILNFSKILLDILDIEHLKGNYICEISKSDWPYKKPESKMIFLQNPFFTNPQIDLKGIIYTEVMINIIGKRSIMIRIIILFFVVNRVLMDSE